MLPLRVLHLLPSFRGGGAERQLTYLAIAQAEIGVDVHVGFVHGGPNLERLVGGPVSLHPLRAAGNHDPRLLLRIARLIGSIEPSVVQTWLLQMDVLGGLAARVRGVPWILSERASPEAYEAGWKNYVRRRIAVLADAVVANSSGGLSYWRHLPGSVRLRTIHNIVPFNAIAAENPRADDHTTLNGGKELIVAAGRLSAEKNWFVFLEALDLVLARRVDAHAAIFGDGEQREEIQRRLSTLECGERVHLMGYSSSLWGWLKRASTYASVSSFEGAPNVLLEAMACRCPLVLSDIPAHRELVPSSEAAYVSPYSATAVAEAIERTLEKHARQLVAPVALEVVKQWSPEVIAARYCELYREIVAGPSASTTTENRPRARP